ncbi:hypothetical protein [Thalassolituus sp. UBA2009]|uniref:hypothetical protein n=1 Tax=Thalassolituus sp. UBA2009 TaxID=1947658 RepID=UPI00257D916C|nr:hypothetical protein [Thalassolituus sp. UBA2009]
MDATELQRLVREAAEAGTENVLLRLGLDASEPLKVQKDFAYMRQQRETSEKIGGFIRSSLITIALTGLASVLVMGVKEALK